ncbi:uncharacterized protein [Chironomus tepperi]|uniref:uncharacterized protein isoform X2 n=1 Tax=Chironomus tepperi TaxID=113505 RepID=UPI00391F73F7
MEFTTQISVSKIGSFCGGVYASYLYRKLSIYMLHCTSAALMVSGGVIFFLFEDIYYTILTTRILTGFAFGSSHISSLFYIAEISSKEIRAKLVLFQHLCLTIGMFLHAISDAFDVLFGMGIFLVVITCASFPIGYYTMKESHVFLILNNINNNEESLNRLKHFRDENDGDIDLEHDAMQSYLIDEEKRRFKFFNRHNILTLLVIIMVQNSYISVFNGLHNYLRLIFMKSMLMEWTETVGLSARIVGTFASFLILDCVPKKVHFTIPSGFITIILIIFGSLIIFFSQLWLPLIFFISIEFFLGLGMGGISEILKSELFPIKERWISVCVAYFFEEGLQIISLVILYSWSFGLGSNPTYWPFIFAAILLVCSLMVFFVLKDSRKEYLNDACMLYSE